MIDFQPVLLTVVGQAYAAAGYHLEERPVQWAAGQFRFIKDDCAITYQMLSYSDSEWASGTPSRFRVTLRRGEVQRDLSALVVEDFGVTILPSANHWWTYHTMEELGHALAEAGHLVVGYGIPWMVGDLEPPASG